MSLSFTRLNKINTSILRTVYLTLLLETAFFVPFVALIIFLHVEHGGVYILLYSLFFAFIMLGAAIICGILKMKLLRMNKLYRYESGGDLENWYEITYKYNSKKKWLVRIIDSIENSMLSKKFSNSAILLSPSSNKGRYEKEIAKTFPLLNVYSTDKLDVRGHELSEGNYTYLSSGYDAFEIDKYTNENNIFGNVDIIFDFKGALWHADSIEHFENQLMKYSEVLSEGGIIIVDAYKINRLRVTFNNIFCAGVSMMIGYGENSTYDKHKKNIDTSSFIKEHFNVIPEGEGISEVIIFTKK